MPEMFTSFVWGKMLIKSGEMRAPEKTPFGQLSETSDGTPGRELSNSPDRSQNGPWTLGHVSAQYVERAGRAGDCRPEFTTARQISSGVPLRAAERDGMFREELRSALSCSDDDSSPERRGTTASSSRDLKWLSHGPLCSQSGPLYRHRHHKVVGMSNAHRTICPKTDPVFQTP